MDKDILVKYIDQLIITMGKASDFLKDQIPPVIHEIIMYKGITAIIFLLVQISLIIYFYFLMVKLMKKEKLRNDKYDWEDSTVVGMVAGCIIILISGICFLVNIQEIAMIYFAPRLYILDYLKSFVTTK